MFYKNLRGEKILKVCMENWKHAARIAEQYPDFQLAGDEDELLADEVRACYNCRYRRWQAKSLIYCLI